MFNKVKKNKAKLAGTMNSPEQSPKSSKRKKKKKKINNLRRLNLFNKPTT